MKESNIYQSKNYNALSIMTVLDFREITVKVQDVLLPHRFMQTATELLAIKIGLCKLHPAMILKVFFKGTAKKNITL